MMVIPSQHVADLDDLDEATMLELMTLTQRCVLLLRAAYNPQGFNIGINMGLAAGAGIAEHLHQHIVPRWTGDTNFMSTVSETRVIPQWIDETYVEFSALWQEKFPDQKSASK
jgi:ATP adenylyltransferase